MIRAFLGAVMLAASATTPVYAGGCPPPGVLPPPPLFAEFGVGLPDVSPPDGATIDPPWAVVDPGGLVRFVNFDGLLHHFVGTGTFFALDTGLLPPLVAGVEGGSECIPIPAGIPDDEIPFSCIVHPGVPEGGVLFILPTAVYASVTDQPLLGAGATLELSQPNPAPGASRVTFTLPEPGGQVELVIVDVRGRSTRTLIEASLPAGLHEASWDGADDQGSALPAGVYFYRLRYAGREVETKTVLVR